MTIGTRVDDQRASLETYYAVPSSWTHQSVVFKLVGTYYSKSWNGTDQPKVKPTYKRFSLFRADTGKTLFYKQRGDAPVRLKKDDHSYSCEIYQYSSNLTSWSTYVYGVEEQRNVESARALFGIGGSVSSTSEWNDNDTLNLNNLLREKIAGSDFNMGVFLGEGHQALQMITQASTRIFKSMRALKRGDVAGAANALRTLRPAKLHKSAADNWIELQYGWKPLVQDAYGAAQFLAKVLEFPMIQTYRVKKKKWLEVAASGPNFSSFVGIGDTRVQLIARLSEVNVPQLVGLLDPASVAWELTPWSFVADWFVPIGSYLASRSLAQALTGSFVTTKTRRIYINYAGITEAYNPVVSHVYTGSPAGTDHKINVDRVVSSSLSVPSPKFKTLDKVASWQHCANAVALLTQRFAGRPTTAIPSVVPKRSFNWDTIYHG